MRKIIIEIEIEVNESLDDMDVRQKITGMTTIADLLIVVSSFENARKGLFARLGENMQEQMKEAAKMSESEKIEYLKTQELSFLKHYPQFPKGGILNK